MHPVVANHRSVDHGPFSSFRNKNLSKVDLSSEQKEWLGTQILSKTSTAKVLAKRYSLPVTTLYGYSKRSGMGTKIYSTPGARSKIDEKGQIDIINELQTAKKETKAVKSANLSALLNTKARESNIREGGCGLMSDLSESTMFRTKRKLNITTVVPQTITDARLNAELDIRNYIVESVAQHAFMNICDPNLVINADATTFGVFGSGSSKVAVVRLKDDFEPVTVEKEHGGTLGIYVKVFNQISLGLCCAPAVFLIADDTLGEDTFNVFKVKRLSGECHAGAYGYLVICKTRCGNDLFWEWFWTVCVPEFITSIRESNDLTTANPSFYSLDGEPVQISSLMKFIHLFNPENLNVILVKHAASFSKYSNALDAGNIHKAAKTKQSHMSDERANHGQA